MLLGTANFPLLLPSSESFHVPSHATISLLNMPLPPLSPGASIASGPFRPTLLLLARGAGMSKTSGDFALRGGASTTIGAGFLWAIELGARLLLLALDGATDILLLLFLLFGGEIDDADEGISSDAESLLIEASSAASSHSRTWPKVLSTCMTLEV
jgi:hypothetical protein